MDAAWSGSVAGFLAAEPASMLGALAARQLRRHRVNEAAQLSAWEETVAVLRAALGGLAAAADWHLLLEYRLPRLGLCPDAVLLLPGAIVVIEVKAGEQGFAAGQARQVEDYALDLFDFHEASRSHPIVPIVLANAGRAGVHRPFLLPSGVAPVTSATPESLAEVLASLAAPSGPALDVQAWLDAAYRPVPTIVQAAQLLYARHDVREIAASRADPPNLTRTSQAIASAMAAAQANAAKVAVFVTGIPGAGKTLCGLTAVFGAERETGAAFLTGNPTLVHVLREALARDAMRRGMGAAAARQRMESAIQALPKFRDHYVDKPDECPPERILVIDEAQRCWSRDYAVRKSRDRSVRLTDSEPGLLLDALARVPGFAALIALVGSGQEIHRGEGGIAEWAAALAARPSWAVVGPDDLALPAAAIDPALHLAIPVRQIVARAAADWVQAVLDGDATRAAAIAAATDPFPFRLTRSLPAMRGALREAARGERRAGLVASSGGKRLRAVGLGAELPHMEADSVARWFLDRWPDIRASDALEQVATEFSIQGLELDHVGLCWDGDLIRVPGLRAWQARRLAGTAWQRCTGEGAAHRLNTYRVLLTRARYSTILYVPEADPSDATRAAALLDPIAEFLHACGVPWLLPVATQAAPRPAPLPLFA